jgi:hypothetical protein
MTSSSFAYSPRSRFAIAVKIILQLCIGADVGMGCLGLLQELPGPLVEPTNGDFFLLEHLLHRVQVRHLVSRLLLRRLGPHLKQGAPILEALLLHPLGHPTLIRAHAAHS